MEGELVAGVEGVQGGAAGRHANQRGTGTTRAGNTVNQQGCTSGTEKPTSVGKE